MTVASIRAPITVALVLDSDRARPKHVFEVLATQLRNGDNAVVLGARSSADHPGSWWEMRARRAVRAEAVLRPHDLVLVLLADVELAEGSIDGLIATQLKTLSSAVVPRVAGGPPPPPSAEDAGPVCSDPNEAPGLGDACVLVREAVLAAAGGFAALRSPGGVARVVAACAASGDVITVAGAARARRRGASPSGGDTLVSACMIVRDEVHQLADCVTSVKPFADELVVYDTGSQDRTRALATALGARVVDGYWDDDFARARNDALEYCHGRWILWIDADERLIDTDSGALRALLTAINTEVDGLLVPIDNLRGNEAGTVLTHAAVRLFRREACRWEGRLHEQIVRHGGEPARLLSCTTARLLHRGYLDSAMQARGKRGRNLRSALSELAGGSELDLPTRLVTLGRSHMLAGLYEEGAALCRWAVAQKPGGATRRLALRALGDAYIFLARYDDALAVAEELRGPDGAPELAAIIAGRAHLGLGANEAALAQFASVKDAHDVDGFEYGPDLVADKHAHALLALGRHSDAADVLLATLRRRGGLDTHLGLLIEALDATGRDFAEIVEAVDAERLRAFLPPLLQIEPGVSDRVLERWFTRQPANVAILAAAAEIAGRLDIARQLAWSARLRQAGFAGSCPLIRTAASDAAPAADRAIAAAVAATVFGDERGDLAFAVAALGLQPEERAVVHSQLGALSPIHAERLVTLPSTTPLRPSRPLDDDAHHVVVVSRRSEELRNVALAARIRDLGYKVTLLSPSSSRAGADVLSSLGIDAGTWREGSDWTGDLLSALARLYALGTIDIVVLGSGTEGLAQRVQTLVSTAVVFADTDGHGVAPAGLAPRVFATPSVALARGGLLAVADLRGFDETTAHRATASLRAVRVAVPSVPIALCGDDPARALPAAVGDGLAIGACADPRPWLGASAGLLLLAGSVRSLAEWQALAAASKTPVFLLGADEDPEGFARRVVRGETDPLPPDNAVSNHDDPFQQVERRPRPRLVVSQAGGKPLVRLTSDVASLGSLSQVNRELAARLADPLHGFAFEVAQPNAALPPDIAADLSHVSFTRRPSRPTALEIRHQWPPDFMPPAEGRLVLIQPFEFGGLPAEWIGPLRDVVDELWVPSNWVRNCAIESGVSAAKVHVVPNGVDLRRYRPAGDRYPLRTQKATRLLFVGGCIPRKGFDALLETYLALFNAEDDVCLVVKPFGGADVYAGSSLDDDLRRAAASGGPEIEIVEDQLGLDEMPALYRACDVLVHPYRAEGFALPVAEAMACGLPVVVTAGGACDEFCDEEVGWLVSSRQIHITTAAFTPSAHGAWWLEPDRMALAAALREVVQAPAARHRRGAAGAERIATRWSWEMAASAAVERIETLLSIGRSAQLRHQQVEAAPHSPVRTVPAALAR